MLQELNLESVRCKQRRLTQSGAEFSRCIGRPQAMLPPTPSLREPAVLGKRPLIPTESSGGIAGFTTPRMDRCHAGV